MKSPRMYLNKLVLLTVCSILFLGSCKKDDKSTTNNSNQLSYTVGGLSDLSLKQYHDTTLYLPLGFDYVSGTQERITVTPAGPEISSFTPASITGTPPFSTMFTLHVRPMSSGNLPVTLTATSVSGVTKTFYLNLVTEPNPICADMYVDSFTYTDSLFYVSDGTLFQSNKGTKWIERSTASTNKLSFMGEIVIT